jgi:competence protein ComEA
VAAARPSVGGVNQPRPAKLPDEDALDHADPRAAGAATPEVLQQWRESAARAAGRAYEAAYGREIPETSATMRWRLTPRVAAAVAGAVLLVAAVSWWLAGPGRAAPPPLAASVGSGDAVEARDHGEHASPAAVAAPAEAAAAVVVHVSGEVLTPGLVEVPAGSRVAAAIDAAGGLLEGADQAGVNLAREAVDGEHVHVPAVGEQGDAAGPLSINAASASELEELPGVGPVIAERIVADRDANGPFLSLEDVQRVSGVGPALVARWEGLAQV